MSADDVQHGGPRVTGLAGLPPITQVGRRYPNAPITEAALSLVIDSPTPATPDDLLQLFAGAPEFDQPTPLYSHDEGEWNDLGERRQSRTVAGFYARSVDGTFGVSVSPTSFSFSLLTEYTQWSAFVSAAETCWAVYKAAAHPEVVRTASVRFVNVITPLSDHDARKAADRFEINDYLRTSFVLSPYLPQMVADFYSQVSVPLTLDEFFPALAVITVTTAGPAGLVLDIDVSLPVTLNTQEAGFSEELTVVLDRLRYAKNYVFESCITDATRNVIS